MRRLKHFAVFCIMIIFSAFATKATAVEIVAAREVYARKSKALIGELATNQPGRPTLLFFAGAGERRDIKKTLLQMEGRPTLSEWNVIGIAIADCDNDHVTEWEQCVADALPVIEEMISEGKIGDIYIDGCSNGGVGAYEMAHALLIRGYEVREVNFLDAAIDYRIKKEEIEGLLRMGTKVGIWACRNSEKRVSENSRNLVRSFRDNSNVNGIIMNVGHSNALIDEAYALGLHKNL